MISLPSNYIGASKGFWSGSGPYIYLHKLQGDLSEDVDKSWETHVGLR